MNRQGLKQIRKIIRVWAVTSGKHNILFEVAIFPHSGSMVGPGTLAGGARDPGRDELGGRLLSQPPSVEQDIVYVSSDSDASLISCC